MRRTTVPLFSCYAFVGVDQQNGFARLIRSNEDEPAEIREPALFAFVVDSTLTAVGMTGGFIEEALS